MIAAQAVMLIAAAVLAVPSFSEPQEDRDATIVIAAASDLQFALPAVVASWRRSRPAPPVTTVFGSSGSLFAQAANGAPFDVFLSADSRYPAELVRQGKASAGSLFQYGRGRLALWMPLARRDELGSAGTAGLRVLLAPSIRRIAIANPEHAPYGAAAVEALRHYGILEAVQPRFVRGENATQAAQFVQSGGADAGLIPLALALAAAMTASGQHWVVPAAAHSPIDQAGVVLRQSRRPGAARSFCEYLVGREAQAVFGHFGIEPPGTP